MTPEQLEALARRPFAHAQPLAEDIQRQRLRGNKQQPIDFTDGFRHAEHLYSTHKKIDHSHFDPGQTRMSRVGGSINGGRKHFGQNTSAPRLFKKK